MFSTTPLNTAEDATKCVVAALDVLDE
jgi:hypothetical protein